MPSGGGEKKGEKEKGSSGTSMAVVLSKVMGALETLVLPTIPLRAVRHSMCCAKSGTDITGTDAMSGTDRACVAASSYACAMRRPVLMLYSCRYQGVGNGGAEFFNQVGLHFCGNAAIYRGSAAIYTFMEAKG
eukprot:2117020-Rhodomonas_salina.1